MGNPDYTLVYGPNAIAAAAVTTPKIADAAVTTEKLGAAAVTKEKLAGGLLTGLVVDAPGDQSIGSTEATVVELTAAAGNRLTDIELSLNHTNTGVTYTYRFYYTDADDNEILLWMVSTATMVWVKGTPEGALFNGGGASEATSMATRSAAAVFLALAATTVKSCRLTGQAGTATAQTTVNPVLTAKEVPA